MKNIIITGTSSGIGYAIAKELLQSGYRIWGISRTPSGIVHDNFTELIYDLNNISGLDNLIAGITEANNIDILINNAGVAYYGPAETISSSHIQEMMTVNAMVPMIMTSRLLRTLSDNKGTIINISSITAKHSDNTHGAVYGATKAALSSFGDSVFAEARKRGIRVTNIHPDLTESNLYRNADFTTDSDELSHLLCSDIAALVVNILSTREGVVVRDITISPQLNRISRRKPNND